MKFYYNHKHTFQLIAATCKIFSSNSLVFPWYSQTFQIPCFFFHAGNIFHDFPSFSLSCGNLRWHHSEENTLARNTKKLYIMIWHKQLANMINSSTFKRLTSQLVTIKVIHQWLHLLVAYVRHVAPCPVCVAPVMERQPKASHSDCPLYLEKNPPLKYNTQKIWTLKMWTNDKLDWLVSLNGKGIRIRYYHSYVDNN